MLRLSVLVLLAGLLLSGCGGGDDQPPDDPLGLLREAAEKIRAADTFRLYIEQSGRPALFYIYFDEAQTQLVEIEYRFARAQYVAPDILQATARIIVKSLGNLPIDAEIFSRATAQWYRLPPTLNNWIRGDFAPGFNPATLIADDSGFQTALTALNELAWVENITLDNGQPVFHLTGLADGSAVRSLVVGLIDPAGDVPVDVYVNRETGLPARLVLRLPETADAENPDPTTWTIDVYDIGAPAQITAPEGADAEADAEADESADDGAEAEDEADADDADAGEVTSPVATAASGQ